MAEGWIIADMAAAVLKPGPDAAFKTSDCV
ncbi:hypothetical protein M671_00545 [Neisseria gonorrhoeae CH811]|nr:hypothetical protein T556_05140 [Neisseria gonorrhoeae NG-k51.05]KLR94585.1 hypothetical protein M685_09665 [Neisseria gonorrhoeae SK16259]KLS13101.1 hypothetical protein M716_00595 [Neisseria gonorrhoeae SK32402]KLS23312.1 hypothetical protein M733_08955 [Neisseria gonorrhoeae ATL_2011_05-13]KLS57409.1 hypothetical protein M742_07180 [Neisseria gonorrhoeae NYC_2011_05_07]KLS89335.1 hypothetical protein M780_00875 [Neisseria gonorrhoeae MU_NG14]KLT02760.1 hypothetical protein M671_00545 [N